jgi:hypothetical protein
MYKMTNPYNETVWSVVEVVACRRACELSRWVQEETG